MLALRKRLRSQESSKKTKKVIRVEKKHRKSPNASKSFRKTARKQYSGKDDMSGTRPSEIRRRKPRPMPVWESHEDAFDWLLSMKFVNKITCCPNCLRRQMVGPFFPEQTDRSTHFRCTRAECGARSGWLEQTIFRGLRVTPRELEQMLVNYSKMSLTKAPTASDFVPLCDTGRTQAGFL